MNPEPRRCYIVGAGFSAPFGLPLARELTRLVFDHTFHEHTQAFRKHWLELVRHLFPTFDPQSEKWPDFEKLITCLDEWVTYQQEFEGRDRNDDPFSPCHLRKILLHNLAQLICEKASACPPNSLDPLREFVQNAASNRFGIVSFNWDPLIEIACGMEEIDAKYDLGNGPALQLIKPHGSVTLARSTEDDYERHVRAINGFGTHIDYKSDDGLIIRADNPSDALNRIVFPFENRLMVDPVVRKVYNSEWLRNQWKHAFRLLKNAQEIVIIGFSMPPFDFRPRVMLQAATIGLRLNTIVKIISRDDKRIRRRYRKLLPSHLDIRFIDKDWIDWFQDER